MRLHPALIVLVGLGAPSAALAGPIDATNVVTDLVTGIGRTMNDPGLSLRDREQDLRRLLQDDCDMSRIVRYVLGSYRAAASDGERLEFSDLFQRWVARSFIREIGRFDAAALTVVSARPEADGVVVTTELASSDSHPTRIDWQLDQVENRYRIVDVTLEGVSMALVEREEIGAVIRHNGGTVAGMNHALGEYLASQDGSTVSVLP